MTKLKVTRRNLQAKCILTFGAFLTTVAIAAADVNGVRLDTNALETIPVTAAQGISTDGKNLYGFSRGTIQIYDGHGRLQTMSNRVFDGVEGYNHLGDGCYYDGRLYISAELYGATKNASIFIFSATNLSRLSVTVVSNWQEEISSVCVVPDFSNNVALFTASFPDGCHNGHETNFYQFTLNGATNITFVRKIPYRGDVPQRVQGISYYGGMLYVMGDDHNNGDFYQVNPTNGQTIFIGQLHRPDVSEWEGLDTTPGVLIATANYSDSAMVFNFLPISRAAALSKIGFISDDSQSRNSGNNQSGTSGKMWGTIAFLACAVCLGALIFVRPAFTRNKSTRPPFQQT
ncbi:MAG TPA: hypothetical protein VMB22_05215 [Verrucomicrobiae bacterium]|nr:hypothetical protein [Verrucomicrobiae bacterium]